MPRVASAPPGPRTRWISGSARSVSNQWNAEAATTASAEPSGERQLLGRAREHLGVRHGRLELPAHLRERLDRDHAGAGGNEVARQLARARADVDDRRSRLQAEAIDQPGDHVGRVGRPPPLVRSRRPSRTPRDEERSKRVPAQYAPRLPITAGTVFARIEMSSQIDQFSR